MPKGTSGAGLSLLLALFLIANRGAYKGFFQDDDMDNIAWTSQLQTRDFVNGLLTPVLARNNFRPVGHSFYNAMGRLVGLKFKPYVGVIQALHLVNAILLWLLLQRLGITELPRLAGVLFFLFHPATFDAYWRPMYVFDVFCTTFCLLSLVAWTRGAWILSFAAFWFAYKSKELAVMLPAALLAYEWLLGQRRWKPLLPFLLVSLSFGLQGLSAHGGEASDYGLKISSATVFFYGAWIAPVLMLVFLRDRRVLWSVSAVLAVMLPVFLLPGRLFTVYMYLACAVGAIAIAAALEQAPRPIVAGSMAVWAFGVFLFMREYRRGALAVADENRTYVARLENLLRSAPGTHAFLYDGRPEALNVWGISGALRVLTGQPDIRFAALDAPEAESILREPRVAVLTWDANPHKLYVAARNESTPLVPRIEISPEMRFWQFESGWYGPERTHRWSAPVASAVLDRPAGCRAFAYSVIINDERMATGHLRADLFLDGAKVASTGFGSSGQHNVPLVLPPGPAGPVQVEFRIEPVYYTQGGRALGLAFTSFGFLP